MNFLIADTFRSSLARLTGNEQKAAKRTAFDLQLDPSHPSLQFHRLDRARDPNFWSIRVNGDIRIIIHRTDTNFLICYVDHHDKAYDWGERRRLDKHPKTGAAQLVEIRELVEEIPVYVEVEATEESPKKFALNDVSEEQLLSYGVPEDWVESVLKSDVDELLEITEHLPSEAAEAVLHLADGKIPDIPMPSVDDGEGFDHPDAERRFRLFTDEEELKTALEYPWEQWTIFLHPSQKRFVEQTYNGPARIGGSAGTGKTVVAIHRAVELAKRNPDSKVLLTTFSPALADLLKIKVQRLVGERSEITSQIVVKSLSYMCADLYAASHGDFVVAEDEDVRPIIEKVLEDKQSKLPLAFVIAEWKFVIDAWQVESLEEYQGIQRIGRRTRLGSAKREELWEVCTAVRERLEEANKVTWGTAFSRVEKSLEESGDRPFDFIIVDEAQDLSVPQLRLLALMGDTTSESLFFAGDGGQRIFQQPFSWKSLGVDIRGRSNRLRVNYRTSHQIRKAADILLPDDVSDADGNSEERTGVISVFNGASPEIMRYKDADEEIEGVTNSLIELLAGDFNPEEVGVFVRSETQMARARRAFKNAGVEWVELERSSMAPAGTVALATMHLAKGLEFRGVIIMACDHNIVPLAERITNVVDESELEEVYNTERHLLYVAATRARECLLVTGVDPISEFVEDMKMADG